MPLLQPEGGSKIQLQLICAERGVQHPAVPLGSILVDDVVERRKFAEESWVNVAAITNGAIKVRCLYGKYRKSLKTLSSQHSKMKEFCGGTSDWCAHQQDAAADTGRHSQKSEEYSVYYANCRYR